MSGDTSPLADITIIDFWADWCGACRMIKPVVLRIVAGQPGVALREVNVADEAEFAKQMAVLALPTLVFMAPDGRELRRLSGPLTGKRIEDALREARAGLP